MSISSFGAGGVKPGVCTSTTRPTTPYLGQIIFETDTGYLRVWDGAAWDYLSQWQTTAAGYPVSTQNVNAQTGTTYTPTSSDNQTLVTLNNSSAITVTINTSLALATGQRIDFAQLGTGQVTFSASSTTVNGTPGLKLRARYSAASLVCLSSNTYLLIGDLSA